MLTLHGLMSYSLPGSSVRGILQARILEWLPCTPPEYISGIINAGVEPVSHVFCIGRQVLYHKCHLGSLPNMLLLSRFSYVRLCATPQTAATRLPCPWDSPGKNTGVGCHFLLQCIKMKTESEVAQSCLTLCDPMDCSPPGSSVHGILQARGLEWGAIAFSDPTQEHLNI